MQDVPTVRIDRSLRRSLSAFGDDRLGWLDRAAALGPLAGLRFGPATVFVVTDPELAAEHFFGMLAGHRQYRALLGVAEPGRPSDGTRAAETVRAFLRAYRG